MKKELPITPPEGYEIDKERMVFVPKEIDLFPDYNFCRSFSWNEEKSYQISFRGYEILRNKILAFTKLIELRDEVNRRDGLVVDWKNPNQIKFCLEIYEDNLMISHYKVSHRPLAFRTQEIAQQFTEKYKHLIDQCPDLI